MVPVLLGWYLYEKTGSAFLLGLLGLSEVIPAVLLALPAGVRADTGHIRNIMTVNISVYLIILVTLLGITSTDEYEAWMTLVIFALVGGTGVVRAFLSPCTSALLGQVVNQEELVEAASVSSMIWLLAAVVGPLLAGFFIGWLGITFSLGLSFTSVLISLLFVRRLHDRPPVKVSSLRTWESVKEGLEFLKQQRALTGTMGLDMFAVLFGGAVALLPVFAKDILLVGPVEFGFLQSATYLGNLLVILYLTKFPLRGGQGMVLFRVVFGFGICMIIFAVSPWFWLSFVALFVSGLLDGVSVVIRGTIFQIMVPETMRGRVASVNSIFINSSNELGQFESGLAAAAMGTVPSVVFGGMMTMLVTGLFYWKVPSLRALEYPERE